MKVFTKQYFCMSQERQLRGICDYISVSEKIGCSVEHDALVREFMHGFMHENALNPMIYPSLR